MCFPASLAPPPTDDAAKAGTIMKPIAHTTKNAGTKPLCRRFFAISIDQLPDKDPRMALTTVIQYNRGGREYVKHNHEVPT